MPSTQYFLELRQQHGNFFHFLINTHLIFQKYPTKIPLALLFSSQMNIAAFPGVTQGSRNSDDAPEILMAIQIKIPVSFYH